MNRAGAFLLILLTIALAIRLGWAWHQPADETLLSNLPDQVEYLSLGRNLLHHHSLYFYDNRFEQVVYAYRTPGYPLFVAACGGNVVVIRLAQVLLDTSTVLAIYLLGRRIIGRSQWLSLLAAGLVAFNPFLIYFSGLILSETLFTSLLAWGIYFMAIAAGKPLRIGAVFTGGLVLGFAIMVRPSAMLLPVLVPLGACWMNLAGSKAYQTIRRAMILSGVNLALMVMMLLPWAIRNHRILGHWIWTTTNSGITAYDGFNPQATGASDQRFLQNFAGADLKQMGEVQRSRYLQVLAWEYATSHPWRSVELAASKIARTWSPLPLSNQFGSKGLYVLAALCYSVPFDLLALVGLGRRSLARSAKVFVLIPAIYFTVIHAMSVGSLRYRIPVEPPMAILAAVAFIRRPKAN
ncbi:MAG: glycosyltransferase family 39 protein [Phycisphaerales bacterium]|jgi:4-amino-4-deoxy-L-arabinose transferase-like glycosyltransferase|nr:glycosyltransferase family 39 protein [Phycisphaerales bacterium]